MMEVQLDLFYDEYYSQGRNAADWCGVRNPYAQGSPEYVAWADGYTDEISDRGYWTQDADEGVDDT